MKERDLGRLMPVDVTHAVLHTDSAATGEPRRHQLWFVLDRADLDSTVVHLFSAGPSRPAWIENLTKTPLCRLEIGTCRFDARFRGPLTDEDESDRIIELFADKYRDRIRSTPAVWSGVRGIITVDLI